MTRRLHVHWARPAGHNWPLTHERCRCGRHRGVRIHAGIPVWWTHWHDHWEDAVREYLDTDHHGHTGAHR